MSSFSPDESAIIRAHRFDTTCFVLAEQGQCLDLARERVRAVTGRKLQLVESARLPARLPGSWMLAVILCPGDTTIELGRWAARLSPSDQTRIRFYEPEDLQAQVAFAGWLEQGLPDPGRRRVRDFRELNRTLGVDLNARILQDHERG